MTFRTLKKTVFCLAVCLWSCVFLIQTAGADEADKANIPLNPYGIRSSNPYVVDRFMKDGQLIDKVIVPSRPNPPKGYNREVVMVPEPDKVTGTNSIANVPAMTWCFGCAATSAAMMFGHYDNTGYSNMYAGPVNGGVFPMTNATWGTVVINGETRALCPLSATRLGLDGRTTKGHVDDYWVKYASTADDPYLTGGWTAHTHGECTGDYMGTNQSSLGNTDGSTSFYYNPDGSPYTGFSADDGCHGMRLFAESRGYTVDANFFQLIYGYNGNTQGFTFNNFKNEIDAGRPVLIQVEGHTMLGYGYNDTGSIIYIHDTWDYSNHSMTWGGRYPDLDSGMRHYAVTVLRLASAPPAPGTCPDCPANGIITNAKYAAGTVCSCSHAVAITLGSNVTVENNAEVTFSAPVINVQPGFHAENGSTVTMQQ